jgi:DNA-binding transcriptional regulator of glucitol operon
VRYNRRNGEKAPEVAKRTRGTSIVSFIVLLWLIVGAVAAFQRGYFQGTPETCAQTGTVLVTIVAGPLNYMGVNPQVGCELPQPSQ